ncbi:MAG: cytochrome c-type biogenesis protein CcmH [Alphaproteobacteria bacterium]|nr:cytochrome c-type biogenesis protein CcmH [Alphaproteobacteria bacterium]
MRRAALATLFAALLSAQALAVEPDEVLADPALEARARALSAELRCLVCQNQSIDESDAPLARDLRLLIREELQKGESDAEVMAFIVDRYGEFVLLKPRFSGRTLALWLTPFAVLLIAAIVLFRRRPRAVATAEGPLSEAERDALRKLDA